MGRFSPSLAPQRARRMFPAGTRVLASLLTLVSIGAADAVASPAPVQVQALVAEARAAAAQGRLVEAQDLVTKAARLAPADPEVVRAANDIAAQPAGAPVVGEDRLIGWAQAEIEQARQRAVRAARDGRYEDAAEALVVVERALVRQRLAERPGVAERLVAVRDDIVGYRRRQRQVDDAVTGQDRATALGAARQRVAEQEDGRERRFHDRLERIAELRRRGYLDAALADSRRLLRDEPDREEARTQYASLVAESHEARGLTLEQRKEELGQELAERTRRDLMPGLADALPVYPEGWLHRHEGRTVGMLSADAEPAWRADLRHRLEARMDFQVEGVPLAEALARVARHTGTTIVVDPQLAAQDKTVSMMIPGMRADNVLSWICRQAGTTWGYDREAIVVGTMAKPEARLAVFDVAALVHQPQDKPGPTWFVAGQDELQHTTAETVKAPTIEDLVDLIHKTVAPAVWEDPGNGITARGTVLYVTAPAEVHRLIQELIRAQESSLSLMVRVDSRWLEVQDGYFEQVGVTWTTAGSRVHLPNLVAGAQRSFREGQVQVNTVDQLPGTATTLGANYKPAITLSIAHMGPVGLSAMISAGERAGQIRTLMSPSLTTMNGVRGNFFVGKGVGYLGGYETKGGGGNGSGGLLSPHVKVAMTGIGIDVKPIVSSDRKYVTLDLLPVTRSLVLYSETIQSLTHQGGGGGGMGAWVEPSAMPPVVIRLKCRTCAFARRQPRSSFPTVVPSWWVVLGIRWMSAVRRASPTSQIFRTWAGCSVHAPAGVSVHSCTS